MTKKLLLIFSFLFIICCNYEIVDKPGLKGRIKKVIDYKIMIDKDNKRDTFSISTTKFNNKGQIIETDVSMLYSKSTYNGINVYNSKDQIIKEIGYFDNIEIIVEYIYKDSLLIRTYGKSEYEEILVEMNEEYFYNNYNKLIKRVYSDISIEQENQDTVSKNNFTYNYDVEEKLTESKMNMWSIYDSLKVKRIIFEYNDLGLQINANEFNENDDLIETDIFKYEYDKKGNWVMKENFENDTLKNVISRKIEYK